MNNELRFDRVLATIDMMPVVLKIARFLGPKGLMPNIKTGTLTSDIASAVKNAVNNVSLISNKETSSVDVDIAKVH